MQFTPTLKFVFLAGAVVLSCLGASVVLVMKDRYQVAVAGDTATKIDTLTGRSWKLFYRTWAENNEGEPPVPIDLFKDIPETGVLSNLPISDLLQAPYFLNALRSTKVDEIEAHFRWRKLQAEGEQIALSRLAEERVRILNAVERGEYDPK